MSIIPYCRHDIRIHGPGGRRSTRIERPVPLLITGHDGLGQEFLERTSAVSLNLHGCRYPSRHDCHVGSWITLQIGEAPLGEIVTTVRAQVRSVQIPRNPRDLYHVGVELEKPENVWRVPAPPPDWLTQRSGWRRNYRLRKNRLRRQLVRDERRRWRICLRRPQSRPARRRPGDQHGSCRRQWRSSSDRVQFLMRRAGRTGTVDNHAFAGDADDS